MDSDASKVIFQFRLFSSVLGRRWLVCFLMMIPRLILIFPSLVDFQHFERIFLSSFPLHRFPNRFYRHHHLGIQEVQLVLGQLPIGDTLHRLRRDELW